MKMLRVPHAFLRAAMREYLDMRQHTVAARCCRSTYEACRTRQDKFFGDVRRVLRALRAPTDRHLDRWTVYMWLRDPLRSPTTCTYVTTDPKTASNLDDVAYLVRAASVAGVTLDVSVHHPYAREMWFGAWKPILGRDIAVSVPLCLSPTVTILFTGEPACKSRATIRLVTMSNRHLASHRNCATKGRPSCLHEGGTFDKQCIVFTRYERAMLKWVREQMLDKR